MSELINIYQYNTADLRATVDPDDKSTQDCGIMRGDTVNLNFTDATFIEFRVGDYATLFGGRYRMNRDSAWGKIADRNWQYTLVLEGSYHQLGRVSYFTLDEFNHLTKGKFELRGRPVDFLDLVVSNMNRVFPGEGWVRGMVVDADYQSIPFDSQSCLQVLSTLADKYNTEFLINGTVISLIKTQPASGQVLEYGRGKALYGIARGNQNDHSGIITRLYVYGSSKNIGDNYRGGADRLRMADSLYIDKNVSSYGVYEDTIVFDGTNGLAEIFPHRTGTVSAVTANNIFTDASMDFDVNAQLMPGVTAKVTFNTGQLAGVTFEVSAYDDGTKTFTINPNTDSQTVTLPNDDLKPAVGDKYVIVDIIMPLAYVTQAEADLRQAGVKWLNDNGPAKFVFTPNSNPLYFQSTGIELHLGYSYQLLVADAGVSRQTRVMSWSRNLRKPNIYTNLVLSDTVVPQLPIVKLLNTL